MMLMIIVMEWYYWWWWQISGSPCRLWIAMKMLWRPQAFSAKDGMLEYSLLKEKDAEIFSPQATGISTGSVYKDFALLKNGFVPCFDTNIMILQNMYINRINYKQLWFIQLLVFWHPGGLCLCLGSHNCLFISTDNKLNESKLFARDSVLIVTFLGHPMCYVYGYDCTNY